MTCVGSDSFSMSTGKCPPAETGDSGGAAYDGGGVCVCGGGQGVVSGGVHYAETADIVKAINEIKVNSSSLRKKWKEKNVKMMKRSNLKPSNLKALRKK